LQTFEQEIRNHVEQYFKQYPRHIEHTMKVLGYAKQILKAEPGNREVVLAAALLHDIGLPESKKKYGSDAGKYQQIEGPPIARDILEKVGADEKTISRVCDIVANHHQRGVVETNEFNILWDADWLVNFGTGYQEADKLRKKSLIEKIFITDSGKAIAEKVYL